tara:strand:+ start:1075 stop:1743 length:669 start_codon:yes stop_codon:yes gene_type:complete
MKTIPMIFNQQMVTALVDGRKTVTRRPLSNQPIKNGAFWDFKWGAASSLDYLPIVAGHATANAAPFKIGDLIWVRETFCIGRFEEVDAEHPDDRELIIEQCTGDCRFIPRQFAYQEGATELDEVKWKPSIHMPRKASRLTLRVTNVRCERVQLITEESAQREGCAPAFIDEFGNCPTTPRFKNGFYKLWDSIYSNWDENPWVWVIEFELIKSNIDKVVANEH